MSPNSETMRELEEFFFEGYFKTWVAIARSEQPAANILKFWSVPMYAASMHGQGWLADEEAVIGLLNTTHAPLKEGGYSHTVTLDRELTLFNENAGCLDAIWSRRAADESELERISTHFDARRTSEGWRVIGLSNNFTRAENVDDIWTRYRMPG